MPGGRIGNGDAARSCVTRSGRAHPYGRGWGGGEETIKREAGRAPRQKEQSSGPARSGRCTGTLGRAPGCVEKWARSPDPVLANPSQKERTPEALVLRNLLPAASACTRPSQLAAADPPFSSAQPLGLWWKQPVSIEGRRAGAGGGGGGAAAAASSRGPSGRRRRGPGVEGSGSQHPTRGSSEGPGCARELEAGLAGALGSAGPGDRGRAARGELMGIGGWGAQEQQRTRRERWAPRGGWLAGPKMVPGNQRSPGSGRVPGALRRGAGSGGSGYGWGGGRGAADPVQPARRPAGCPGPWPQMVAFPSLVAFLLLLLLGGGDLYSLPPPLGCCRCSAWAPRAVSRNLMRPNWLFM